jgi:uncharacterized alpha-E superfamily protein
MILLNSNAQHVFWLGRYISRVQYLCSQFPFQDDNCAAAYAHAFCLPAFDSASLNELVLDEEQPCSFKQQFVYTKNNILELRGVLSAKGYAELNKFVKIASENPSFICDVVMECHDVLEAENQDIFLFFKLGQKIEELDRQIRLEQETQESLQELSVVISLLDELGWDSISDSWDKLLETTDGINFYHFSDSIHQMFEVDA